MKILDGSLIFEENTAERTKAQQNVQNIGDPTQFLV